MCWNDHQLHIGNGLLELQFHIFADVALKDMECNDKSEQIYQIRREAHYGNYFFQGKGLSRGNEL
jgi:hypothetical protein